MRTPEQKKKHAAYMIEWRKKQPIEYKEKQRQSFQRFTEKNPAYHYEYNKSWRKNNLEKSREYAFKYRSQHPERKRAQNMVRTIPIPKGQLCQKCNSMPATTRHHPDYNKPLVVEFLCAPCNGGIQLK